MRPQDILPDNLDEVALAGVRARKGSVAAFIANARILTASDASDDARRTAEADLADLVPALTALGLFDVFAIRDPRVHAIVERYR